MTQIFHVKELAYDCYTFQGPRHCACKPIILFKSQALKHQTEGTGTSYFETVNLLLMMYATDDVIAEMNTDMLPSRQL